MVHGALFRIIFPAAKSVIKRVFLPKTIALFSLLLGTQEGMAAESVVRVGVYQNPPKVFLDEEGKANGFFPTVLSKIAEAENLTLEYVPCVWESCLSDLEAGGLDLMVDVAYSPQRDQRFDFNEEVVFQARSFLYTTPGITVEAWSDLDQKRVAVLKDSIQEERLRDRAQALGIEPIWIEVNQLETIFEQLDAGNVDLWVANEFIGQRLQTTYSRVQRSNLVLNSAAIHFAVPQGKNQPLLTLIDRHLVQLKETPDSIYHQALQRWLINGGNPSPREWLVPTLTIILILITLGSIGIIIIANQRLRQELRKRYQAEAQFKQLIQNVPGAVLRYIMHPDGTNQVPYMSPVCETLWEIKASEVEASAQLLWEMVHPDDLEAMQESLMLSAATLKPWFAEWRIRTPSGKAKWLQGRGNPKEGKSQAVVWDTVIIDVTGQKLIEQALSESERKLQEITNAVPGAVYQYQITAQGQEHFLFMSDGINRLLELSPADVMNDPELMWERVGEETRSRFIEYSAANLSPWQYEFEAILPNGEKKWIKGESIPKANEDGVIWNGILVDISWQKWQEQLLATQQEILEDLAEGDDLESIFTELIRLIEQQTDELSASILLLSGNRLWHCGQSQLPSGYLAGINGLEIGEAVGSCGRAAACGEPVIVSDIETDPLWENYCELARQYRLKSCWSMPIFSSTREILGTFALYSEMARKPTAYERQLIEIATKVAALAIERKQQDSILKEKVEQERLLTQTAARIRQSLDLQEVLDQTVQEVRNYLETDRVLIYQINDDSAKVIAESVEEDCISILNKEINDPCLQSSDLMSRFQQGYVQVIADVDQADLESCHREMLQGYAVKGNVVLGILQEQSVWGFLIAQHCRDRREWNNSEIDFLKRLSEQVAIAIQQSELYQQVNVELIQNQELADQLHFQAMHDTLTHLPNRSLLMDRLQHTFELYRRRYFQEHDHFALLFLDLNRFKLINDTLGHDAGDELLITVADRLRQRLREMDTVARLGGDEFVVIVEQLTGEQAAIEVANRIHATFAAPAEISGQAVEISTSIGIVMDSPDYNYPEEMLRDADIAMYQAKKNHLPYVVFQSSMQVSVSETVKLEAELRTALEKQEFVLYYQPLFYLATGEIKGFEALIRWQHPTRGLLLPNQFIPMAKQTQLNSDLERWTLQTACSQLKQWRSEFPCLANATMHINLSEQQLEAENFVPFVEQQLAAIGSDPVNISLEITEKKLIESQGLARNVLSDLEALGVSICLDDFGGIYSSLRHLSYFPIHEIKLDPSLIQGLQSGESGQRNQQIIKAIRYLCNNFEINPIAEGVETAEQTEVLKKCGCEVAQGVYFSHALPASEITDLLAQ